MTSRGAEIRFFDLDGNETITEDEITRALNYFAATRDPADFQARARRQFKDIMKFDADEDGIIHLSELPRGSPKQKRSFRTKLLQERRRRLQNVVRVFDNNGDGVVDESEFLDQLKEAFGFYDKDANGIADDFD